MLRDTLLVEITRQEEQRIYNLAIYMAAHHQLPRLRRRAEEAFQKFVESIGGPSERVMLRYYRNWLVLDEATKHAEYIRTKMNNRTYHSKPDRVADIRLADIDFSP